MVILALYFYSIILSRGWSNRYRGDKSLHTSNTTTLLQKITTSLVLSGAEKVYIYTKKEENCHIYSRMTKIICRVDPPSKYGDGPASLILSLLQKHAFERPLLFIPNDLPNLTPRLIRNLVFLGRIYKESLITPIHGDGYGESLIQLYPERCYSKRCIRYEFIDRLYSTRGYLRTTDLLRYSISVVYVCNYLLTKTPWIDFTHIVSNTEMRKNYSACIKKIIVRPNINRSLSLTEMLKTEKKLYYMLGLKQVLEHIEKDFLFVNKKNHFLSWKSKATLQAILPKKV